jgi:DNA helicase HerA-like ATPase
MMTTEQKPIGYINFDGLTGENNEVEIRVPGDRLDRLHRGQYVLMQSGATGASRLYLARVVRGPFYVPDAVSRDSAFARAAVLQADEVTFRPDYHGVCRAEVLGEILDDASLTLVGSSSRPFPQTAVLPLQPEQIERLLGLGGDIYLGELAGYEGVRVHFRHGDKRVLPRNLGIFGTVGSGKTNTSQVLIEEASACGWAVIVLDVEGEYVEMDKPSEEAERNGTIRRLMGRFHVKPKGIEDLQVLHCIGTEPARAEVSREFGICFANIDPYILGEILSLTDAQMERLLEVHFELTSGRQTSPAAPARPRPGLAGHLLAEDTDEEGPAVGLKLIEVIQAVEQRTRVQGTQGRVSWQVLLRKLRRLQRSGIFDTDRHLGDYSELLKGGMVSVFDLSNSYDLWVNNIVISDILRGVFRAKVRERETPLPPVLVVIEEAHTFVSRERAAHMEATLDRLREISRRGRKRWVSLCFISQQPSHLPPEIYELCNTKIVHQTTGGRNLEALKNSAGGVNEAIWGEIPVLGQGRSLVISPQFRHPLLCDIRPCSSNRRFTE